MDKLPAELILHIALCEWELVRDRSMGLNNG